MGLLLLGGGLLYAPHLTAPFVSDDYFIFLRVREGGAFGVATHPPTSFYRPLTSLHYYLDYRLWGLQPLWSHLVDVGWHLLCTGLVALLSWCWWRDRGWLEGQVWRATVLTAALFLVLPVHAEAVAWMASRADLVTTAVAIASLLMVRQAIQRGGWLWEGLALLCFTAGLFAKESLLTFPLIAWLWLRHLKAPHGGWRVLPYLAVLTVFLWLRSRAVGGLGAYPQAWEILAQPWWILIHLMVYLAQLAMPTILFGLGRDGIDTLLWLGWGLAIAVMLWGWKRSSPAPSPQRGEGLLVGFALVSLLPVLLFKPSPWHFLNSRYSYLASAWLVVAAAGILAQGWERSKLIRGCGVALLLLYAAGTLRQVNAWATAGKIAHSTLQSLQSLPADRPIVILSVPDHYRGAYIWRTGIHEAIALLLPERAQMPLYALSRFTMRLAPDTAVLYDSGTARLSRSEDIFLPPENTRLLPDSAQHWQLQPQRLQIDPHWQSRYRLVRYENGRFAPVQ